MIHDQLAIRKKNRFREIARKIIFSFIRHHIILPEEETNKILEYSALRSLLDSNQINCVIDVGANIGQTVRSLRGIGYCGFIFSFEPVRQSFSILEKSFAHDPLWKGFQLALGDQNTTLSINVQPESTVMSSLLNFVHSPQNIQTEVVDVIRLDDLFEKLVININEPRVFLKIDTQGYDLKVFRGAKKSLDKIILLQSEISVKPIYQDVPNYHDVLEEYETEGFSLCHVSVVSRNPSGQIQEMNCIMKRS